jgi:hypothetical protein
MMHKNSNGPIASVTATHLIGNYLKLLTGSYTRVISMFQMSRKEMNYEINQYWQFGEDIHEAG